MSYWDHCVIVFRYPIWVVVCVLPLWISALSAHSPGLTGQDFKVEPFVLAVFMQAALIGLFYGGFIK